MELTPQVLRQLADQMEAKKIMPPAADIGRMTLAECGRLLRELLPDQYLTIAVEIDDSLYAGRSVKVKLWDGEKWYEGPTVEAAYEVLRLDHLPSDAPPADPDAMVADLRPTGSTS